MLVLANETNGGLKVRKWIDRFTALLKLEDLGLSTGPAICDEAGMVLERSTVNDELHAALSIVQHLMVPSLCAGYINGLQSSKQGTTDNNQRIETRPNKTRIIITMLLL